MSRRAGWSERDGGKGQIVSHHHRSLRRLSFWRGGASQENFFVSRGFGNTPFVFTLRVRYSGKGFEVHPKRVRIYFCQNDDVKLKP